MAEETPKNRAATKPPAGSRDEGTREGQPALADLVDEEAGVLRVGPPADPTPNERYSLESDDWRTPETDHEAHAKAYGQASADAKFGPKDGDA